MSADLYLLSFVILAASMLNFFNINKQDRANNFILQFAGLFLGLWVLSIIFNIRYDNLSYFVVLTSIPLTIALLTLFIERELIIAKFNTISAQLCGGSLLIAYLETSTPSEFQYNLYNTLILTSLLLLVYRWFQLLQIHLELSRFYGFVFRPSEKFWYFSYISFVVLPLTGYSFAVLRNNFVLANIYNAIAIFLFLLSFSLNTMQSTGLNQKIYAIIYIVNDTMQNYLEFGEEKILDIASNESIKFEFTMGMKGIIDMTSELTKPAKVAKRLNYIGFTDLYAQFSRIDDNQYLICLQERKSKQIVQQLEKLSRMVNKNTSNEEFEEKVHKILGI